MQIKRFEAVDMTEALRMVKREFGDDAVILSAKEVRPRGFFSALRKKHVEITAATDYPADEPQVGNDFTGMLAQQLDDASPPDRVSLSTPALSQQPIEQEKHSLHQPRMGYGKMTPFSADTAGLTEQRATPEAASSTEVVASRLREGTPPLDDMADADEFKLNPDSDDLVEKPFYSNTEKRKIIAMVGPSGAGKSTALAKLAWHCQVVEKKRVGLLSLDRYRMAANSLLETVSRIMILPLTVVQDADGMQAVLNDLNGVDVVLIDTPGMGRLDPVMMDHVCTLLRLAEPDETHLVVNATLKDEVIASTVSCFSSLDPNRLLPTHLDECRGQETLLNILEKTRMPASFFADGLDLMDALKETTVKRIDAQPPQSVSVGARVTAFPGKKVTQGIESNVNNDATGTVQYLANRNSELFHHPTCKSVKRINAENIAAFNSIEQAINNGFKPCRACCHVSMVNHAVTGNACYQRARAM